MSETCITGFIVPASWGACGWRAASSWAGLGARVRLAPIYDRACGRQPHVCIMLRARGTRCRIPAF